jgi:hypothetical protein
MSDGAQKLRRVPLLLQRVTGISWSNQLDPRSSQFPFLAGRGRSDEIAVNDDRSASRQVGDVFRSDCSTIDDYLQIGKAGTVVNFDKGEPFRVAAGADPAFDRYRVLRRSGR